MKTHDDCLLTLELFGNQRLVIFVRLAVSACMTVCSQCRLEDAMVSLSSPAF